MKSPYAQAQQSDNFSPRNSELSTSAGTGLAKYSPPFITGSKVANVTVALAVSSTLAVVAIAVDIAGYSIFSGIKGEFNPHAVYDFAFIPELGSAAFGAVACLALMSSGAFSKMLLSDNTQCARALMWSMVAANFVINTVLGFMGDLLIFKHEQHQHSGFMQKCIWSKLVSLAVLLFIGGTTIALGGEKIIVRQIFNLFERVQKAVDEKIGPGTDFYDDGGYRGLFIAWCATFSPEVRKSSGDLSSSEALLSTGRESPPV